VRGHRVWHRHRAAAAAARPLSTAPG
jgi:hypothetical protein